MSLRLASLAFTLLTVCVASSVAAVPGEVPGESDFAPAELLDIQVAAVGAERASKIGFGQTGPIGVVNAVTQMNGLDGRLELYAASKGFVVNRIGAVYDLEGGAIFRVLGGISLTGSYRMLGYDFLATGSENTEPQLSGGFVGLKLDF